MTRYIIEIDRTSNSSILPENKNHYIYSAKIFDAERDANAYVRDIWAQYNTDDIYLVSVYKATTKKAIEHDGVAHRIGVYRNAECKNSIADETASPMGFYTMRRDSGLALGLVPDSIRWNLETNRKIA